ncbi:unnamed protein product [Macrosiphum euphorbiae]|uniref:Uncharacterized protein n=1 Tax=Macrosiphum euphorbiae TaxID=13131 RepID=A0AAV0VRB8_9HEMI|nr:unnamed protein product [Macrosiphum euphorbiae]
MYRRRHDPFSARTFFPAASQPTHPPPFQQPTCSHFPGRTCQVSEARRPGGWTTPAAGGPRAVGELWPSSLVDQPVREPTASDATGAGAMPRPPVRPGSSAFPGIFRVRPVVRRSADVSPIERTYARFSAATAAAVVVVVVFAVAVVAAGPQTCMDNITIPTSGTAQKTSLWHQHCQSGLALSRTKFYEYFRGKFAVSIY